jgi:hypothetical protein
MAQCDKANAQAVKSSQDAVATGDLVQPFYANETCNPAGSKCLPYLMGRPCECQIVRVLINQLVYQIDLLQSVAQSFKLRNLIPFAGPGSVSASYHGRLTLAFRLSLPGYESAPKLPSDMSLSQTQDVSLPNRHVSCVSQACRCVQCAPSTQDVREVIVSVDERDLC